MNIAVFGWYHHLNAGDDRIQYCLTRWLEGHTLAFLPAGRRPPIQLLRTYDAAIIGGGGLISKTGGMFWNMTRWIRQAGIPIALVGVSIEGITPALRDELRSFLDSKQACFAWFRDRGSLDDIGQHPKAFVAPDITWLYPFPVAPTKAEAGVAVSLRKRGGLPVSDWRDALAGITFPKHAWPLYFEQGGDADVLRHVLPSAPIPEEFTLGPAERSTAVISSRFHGLLFSIQIGRPVLAVGHQPKILRFLEDNDLLSFHMGEDEPQRLGEVFGAFEWRLPEIREQLVEVRTTLHERAREMAAEAKEHLMDAAARIPSRRRRAGNKIRDLLDLGSYF